MQRRARAGEAWPGAAPHFLLPGGAGGRSGRAGAPLGRGADRWVSETGTPKGPPGGRERCIEGRMEEKYGEKEADKRG